MCVVKIAPFQYGVECVYPLALVKARNSIVVIHRVSLFFPQIPWNTIKINASSCELWGANERIVLFKDGRFILILASSLPDSIWCDNKNHRKEINQLIILLKQGSCSPGGVAFHSDDTRSSQNKLYRIEFQGNFHNSRSKIHQIVFNLDQMRCFTFAATICFLPAGTVTFNGLR